MWLSNRQDEGGSIVTVVEVEKYDDDPTRTCYATVSLTDCSRKVCLDFYFEDFKTYQERIDKISLLIGELEEVKKAMTEAATHCQEDWLRLEREKSSEKIDSEG